MAVQSKHEQGLFRVMLLATALSFGILAAIAVSMKDFIGGNAAFEFSYKTVLGFAGGASAGWLLWLFVRRRIRKANSEKQPPGTS